MSSLLFNSNFTFGPLPSTPNRKNPVDCRPAYDAEISPRARTRSISLSKSSITGALSLQAKQLPTRKPRRRTTPRRTSRSAAGRADCLENPDGRLSGGDAGADADDERCELDRPDVDMDVVSSDIWRARLLSTIPSDAPATVPQQTPPACNQPGTRQHDENFAFPLSKQKPRRVRDVRRPPPLDLGKPLAGLVDATTKPMPLPPVDISAQARESSRRCPRPKDDPVQFGLWLLIRTLTEEFQDDGSDVDVNDEQITEGRGAGRSFVPGNLLPPDRLPRSHHATLFAPPSDSPMPPISEDEEGETTSTISSSAPSTPISCVSPFRKHSFASTIPTSASGHSAPEDISPIQQKPKSSSPKRNTFIWINDSEDSEFEPPSSTSLSFPCESPAFSSSAASSRRSSVATFFCRGNRPSIPFRNSRFSLGLGSIADSQIDLEDGLDDMSIYKGVDGLKKHMALLLLAGHADRPDEVDVEAESSSGEESVCSEEDYHKQLSSITPLASLASRSSIDVRRVDVDVVNVGRKHSVGTILTMPSWSTSSPSGSSTRQSSVDSRAGSRKHSVDSRAISRKPSVESRATTSRKPSFDIRSLHSISRRPSVEPSFDIRNMQANSRRPSIEPSFDIRSMQTSTRRPSAEPRTIVPPKPYQSPAMISTVGPRPSMLTGPVLDEPPKRRSRRRTASSECIVFEVLEEIGVLAKVDEKQHAEVAPVPRTLKKKKSFLSDVEIPTVKEEDWGQLFAPEDSSPLLPSSWTSTYDRALDDLASFE